MLDETTRPGDASPLRFRTDDLDVARERITETFADHEVRVADGRALDFRLDLAPASRVVLGKLGYGADVTIDGPPMQRCYHVNLPIAGTCDVRQDGAEGAVRAGTTGNVFGPDAPLTIRFAPDATQYVVKLPKEMLEAHAAKLVGRPLDGSIRFALTFDVRGGPGQALLSTAGFLYAELARPGGLATMPTARHEMESALMTQLLMTIPSQLTDQLHPSASPSARTRVREVMEYLDAHPEGDASTADLADRVGVSERALQAGFREVAGMSPMAYLRGVRLDRVHLELSTRGGAVTDVAARWGFFHPGRFAQQYRARFGERPSDTARCAAR
ncbi:AraC family transcriptional regulator [Actinomycetospora sp. C-140]